MIWIRFSLVSLFTVIVNICLSGQEVKRQLKKYFRGVEQMTEELDLRIPYDEMTRLSLQCQCGAEVIFDLNQELYREEMWDWREKRLECTICKHSFDSRIKDGLQALKAWFDCIGRATKDGRDNVFFRIKRGVVLE